jgi:hypothetical protein
MQPGLRVNRSLKILALSACSLRGEGLHLLAEALVGNATLEALDISVNSITSNGIDDIIQLLESTQLKDIDYDDDNATQRFAHVVSRNEIVKRLAFCLGSSRHRAAARMIFNALALDEIHVAGMSSHGARVISLVLESLPRMKGLKRLCLHRLDFLKCLKDPSFLPTLCKNENLQAMPAMELYDEDLIKHQAAVAAVKNVVTRNLNLSRATSLLELQPHTRGPIGNKSGLWHTAFAKFTSGRDHGACSGASAIFKILHTRPAIFEKKLRRPTAPNVCSRSGGPSTHRPSQQDDAPVNNNGSGSGSPPDPAAAPGLQKRQRLL